MMVVANHFPTSAKLTLKAVQQVTLEDSVLPRAPVEAAEPVTGLRRQDSVPRVLSGTTPA